MARRRVAAAFVSLSLAGAGPLSAQTLTDPSLSVTALTTSGLSFPTAMAFVAPGDFLVLEKNTGRVRRFVSGAIQATPVLDLNVVSAGEQGLLGIAVRAGSPVRVFLYLTEASGADDGALLGDRVYRYDWSPAANGGAGALTNPLLIMDLPAAGANNHHGGTLLLDSSDRLYLVKGDLNHGGQLQNNAFSTPPDDTGVIFRVNLDGTAAAGNPFTPYCSNLTTQTCTTDAGCPTGGSCRTQVARYYAYGVRNGFGLCLDPQNGVLWQTENGPDVMDEVNRVAPGFNSGWNRLMGPDSRDPESTADLFNMPGSGLTYSDPEFSWLTPVAVTAILIPNNSSWGAAYNNRVLVGDANLGNIYSFDLNGTRDGFVLSGGLADLVADDTTERNQVRLGQGFGNVVDIKQGPDNHIYVVSLGNSAIWRISGTVPVELQSFTVE